MYLFNANENVPLYLYNNYDPTITYQAGEYPAVPIVGVGTKVYKALQTTQGNYPPSNLTHWELFSDNMYLFSNQEYASQVDFIVHVPVSIAFNELMMRSQIDQYKLAGKRYQIVTF